ncbi:non-ribosomal peptide synthetase [Pseudoalteromonas sp. MMG022]|uniref:non-ribosomal peptide synthetase n=1 Tax=Pseudoalteromonas sp. MMG022 TaxID=2909978 RepID=UPI001F2F3653|nr:non-ribosomal peptide synthetase [Pseudoalteromonas sp. MMG022]MCF6436732.1 amino acid adenylation domain-containing protein [Pseudoalteromonas sp. MMG022]
MSFNLSSIQQDILFDQLKNKCSSRYNIGGYIEIDDQAQLSLSKIQSAHELLISTFDVFGIRIIESDDGFEQYITDERSTELPLVDVSQQSNPDNAFDVFIKSVFSSPMELIGKELYKFYLVKLAPGQFRYVALAHHVIMDGFGFANLVKSLSLFYRGEQLQQPAMPWQEVVEREKRYMMSAKAEKDKNFWNEYDFPHKQPLFTPYSQYKESQKNDASVRVKLPLSENYVAQIERVSERLNVAINSVYCALVTGFIHKTFGKNNVTIAMPVHNRKGAIERNMLGAFLSYSPMNVDIKLGDNLESITQRIIKVQKKLLRHQQYPISQVITNRKELGLTEPSFDFQFNYLKLDRALAFENDNSDIVFVTNNDEKLPLSVTVWEHAQTGGVELLIDLQTEYFSPKDIEVIPDRLLDYVAHILEDETQELKELSVINHCERQQLIQGQLNNSNESLEILIKHGLELHSDKLALVDENETLSFAQLVAHRNAIANKLKDLGYSKGDTLGLCFERSNLSIVTMLACLHSGISFVPISHDFPLSRIKHISDTAELKGILTQSQLLSRVADLSLPVCALDTHWQVMVSAEQGTCSSVSIDDEMLAYTMFTSGSTGHPKGVSISRGALANFLIGATEQLSSCFSQQTRTLAITTYIFDISLLEILGTLIKGGTLYLASNTDTVNPDRLCEMIESHNINLLQATPTTWKMLFESGWSGSSNLNALVGGEPVTASLAQQLLNACHQVWNCYGPTEATIWSMIKQISKTSTAAMSRIGGTLPGYQHFVLMDNGDIAPHGVVGELCISGASLSVGYLGDTTKTELQFLCSEFLSNRYGIERFYKTGDYVRQVDADDFEYIGRIDEQVKVNGFRIELAEIEEVLRKNKSIREAVVVVNKQSNPSGILVGYVEITSDFCGDIEELITYSKQALSQQLPYYMIPAEIFHIDAIPKTANGKTDRKQLANKQLESSIESGVKTQEQEHMAHLWAQVLNVSVEHIGAHSNFFSLGGSSVIAVKLISLLRKSGFKEAAVQDVFASKNLAQMVSKLHESRESTAHTHNGIALEERIPLTSSQQRLWMVEQLQGDSPEYNMFVALNTEGKVNVDKVERAFRDVINHYPILTANFEQVEGVPVQYLPAHWNWQLDKQDLSKLNESKKHSAVQAAIYKAQRETFDLTKDVKLKASYIDLGSDEGVLLINIHHIVADGWSVGFLLEAFKRFYLGLINTEGGCETSNNDAQNHYLEYAVWENATQSSHTFNAESAYWREKLEGIPDTHNLPLCKHRPQTKSNTGLAQYHSLPAQLNRKLLDYAQQNETTPFVIVHSALSLVLSRHSASNDVVIGTPFTNRRNALAEDAVGVFVNPVVLRANTRNRTIEAYLADMKQLHVEAQINQSMPFDKLVDELKVERNAQYSPIFQIVLNADDGVAAIEQSLKALPFSTKCQQLEKTNSRFDLEINLQVSSEESRLQYIYDDSIFTGEFIETLHQHLTNTLESFTGLSLHDEINQVRTLSESQLQEQLVDFNDTEVTLPGPRLLHQLFFDALRDYADSPAIITSTQTLTYKTLFERAYALALSLKTLGVGPEVLVAILLPKTPEQIIATLAVNMAKGAYLPLSLDWPESRNAAVLRQANCTLLIDEKGVHQVAVDGDKLHKSMCSTEHVQHSSDELADLIEKSDLFMAQSDSDLAYVIFTSGSTGNPKGVAIEHRMAANTILDINSRYGVTELDRVFAISALSFDLSVYDIFGLLAKGGAIVLPDPDKLELPQHWLEMVEQHAVSVWNTVPTSAAFLCEQAELKQHVVPCVRVMMMSGDWIATDLPARLFKTFPRANVYSLGGATEGSIWSIDHPIVGDTSALKSVPYGKPLANQKFYILDENLAFIPKGVTGELFIAGEGVARCYYNDEQRTRERYLPHPILAERLYRTGDLGRYLPDGTIEFCGRKDHQVKIRGFRIELGEIEFQLLQSPQVKSATVIAKDDNYGRKRLVAYICPANEAYYDAPKQELKNLAQNTQSNINIDAVISEVKQSLIETLPSYMIPAAIVDIKELPLTANGKVDKSSLPEPNWAAIASANFAKPETELERKFVDMWTDLLGLDKAQLSVNANFFELGGDSILSIQLVSRAAHEGLYFSVRDLFEGKTIRGLVERVTFEKKTQTNQTSVNGTQTLLPVQVEFFDDLTDLHHFNQSVMLSVPEALAADTLSDMIAEIVKRHDALRLVFAMNEQGTWQGHYRALDSLGSFVEEVHWPTYQKAQSNLSVEQFATSVHKQLDIVSGPLMKVVLLRDLVQAEADTCGDTNSEDRVLFVIHHLLVDGVSWRVILNDLNRLYQQHCQQQSYQLEDKTSSFQEWGEYVQQLAKQDIILKQHSYWQHVVSQPVSTWSDIERDNLDVSCKHEQMPQFREVKFDLPVLETQSLLSVSNQAYKTKTNELLMSALLMTNEAAPLQGKIRIDVEGHGRDNLESQYDLSETVGWFTNIYPCLLDSPSNSVNDIICAVKEQFRSVPTAGAGFAILNRCGGEAQPLFANYRSELLFNYLGQLDAKHQANNYFELAKESSGQNFSEQRAQTHPLILDCYVEDGRLSFSLQYDAYQYSEHFIQQWPASYLQALSHIVAHCNLVNEGSIARRPTPSDFSLASVDQARLDSWLDTLNANELAKIDLYPATGMQQGMLFHSMEEKSAYVSQIELSLVGINESLFKSAWQEVLERHDIFKTSFVGFEQGNIHQLVRPSSVLNWRSVNLSDLTAVEQKQAIVTHLQEDKRQGFSVKDFPLMRFTHFTLSGSNECDSEQGESVLLWTFHHAILDGWCTSIVFSEVTEIYRSLLTNSTARLEQSERYRNYVDWLLTQPMDEAKEYWKQTLAKVEQKTSLPVSEFRAGDVEAVTIYDSLKFSHADTMALVQLARRHQTTVNVILQAAWSLLLSRYTGERNVTFGVTTSGRPPSLVGADKIIGLFINTLPMVVEVDEETALENWLHSIHTDLVEADSYSYLPLSQIQKQHPLGQSLFDSLIVFENYPIDQAITQNAQHAQFEVQSVNNFEGNNYGLSLIAYLGEELQISFEVKQHLLNADKLSQVVKHLQAIMQSMVTCVSTVSDINMLSDIEKKELSKGLVPNRKSYPVKHHIHQAFSDKAQLFSDKTALVFGDEQLSYAELDNYSSKLAVQIIQSGIGQNNLIAVCMNRSFELIVAILAILKSGNGYVPIDPNNPVDRITYILGDTGTSLVLTHEQDHFDFTNQYQNLPVSLQSLQADCSASQVPSVDEAASSKVAYVIYTSGSTGKPKGVVQTHENVMRLFYATRDEFAISSDDTWAMFHSPAFDFSVWEMWGALLHGGKLLLPTNACTRDPYKFGEFAQKHGLTILNQTPSAFYGFTLAAIESKAVFEQLRLIIFGGEALDHDMVERWWQYYSAEQIQLVNMYGITETTVHVTANFLHPDSLDNKSIGKPLHDQLIVVLDQNMRLVPKGVVGEMYVTGAGLAKEYLGDLEKTNQKFVSNPIPEIPYTRLYRTGDLARFNQHNSLEYMGRIDDQVKIRGFRIELGEIEAKLTALDEVSICKVVVHQEPLGTKALIAYIVPHDEHKSESSALLTYLKKALSLVLPSHMVPAYWVKIEALPMTANGKLDVAKLEKPDVKLQGSRVAPTNTLETKLADIWMTTLGLDEIGITDNYFELGGDSIKSIPLVNRIKREIGECQISELFAHPTISELAAFLTRHNRAHSQQQVDACKLAAFELLTDEERQIIEASDAVDAYPLSSLQQGMIFHHLMDEHGTTYHDLFSATIAEPFELEHFVAALQNVVIRQEVLRSTISLSAQRPLQMVYENVELPIILEDLRNFDTTTRRQKIAERKSAILAHGFDYEQPLWRIHIQQLTDGDFVYHFSFHHMLLDGWSVANFNTELFSIYRALCDGQSTVGDPESIRISDYIRLEQEALHSREHQAYWQSKAEQFHTPWWLTRPSGDVQQVSIDLSKNQQVAIKGLAAQVGVQEKTVYTAMHAILLWMIDSNHSVLTSVVTNGRPALAGADTKLGMFLNSVPLSVEVRGKTYVELIKQIESSSVELLPHRYYPISEIQKLAQCDLSASIFNYTNFYVYNALNEKVSVTDFELQERTNFLFETSVMHSAQGEVSIRLKVDKVAFDASVLSRLAKYMDAILDKLLSVPDTQVVLNDLMTPQEMQRQMTTLNEYKTHPHNVESLIEGFAHFVAQSPNKEAIQEGSKAFTYQEIDKMSNRLAAEIAQEHDLYGRYVGLYMGRSCEFVVSVLAVIKSGGAYVPLDPSYPDNRLEYIVQDTAMDLVLTQRADTEIAQRKDIFGHCQIKHVHLDKNLDDVHFKASFNRVSNLIYTSGSTGRPKGVKITQKAIANMALQEEITHIGEQKTILMVNSITFDASTFEIWTTFLTGATLSIYSEDKLDLVKLYHCIKDTGVTAACFTPVLLYAVVDEQPECLNQLQSLLVGGEPLAVEYVKKAKQINRDLRLVNVYGPTETTTFVTLYPILDASELNTSIASIGKPMYGCEVYLLDKDNQLVPEGMVGEICIGGNGLSEGYLGLEEQTANTFTQVTLCSKQIPIYKTGDFARYMDDGNIEILGREDHQVKIRGFRIEVKEIEYWLMQHPDIINSVVQVRKGAVGQKLLIAFYTTENKEPISAEQLRSYMSDKVPDYMFPSYFIQLGQFPSTPNGKVDYQALSAIEYQSEKEGVAPRNDTERQLVQVWSECLGLSSENIAIFDNFFELGGDSLLLLRVAKRIEETFKVNLSVQLLFSAQTIAEIAALIETNNMLIIQGTELGEEEEEFVL